MGLSVYPFLHGKLVYQNVFASEIIFKDGSLVSTTTYLTIGNKYLHGGKIGNLLEDNTTAKEVRSVYGSPGDLWCGTAHYFGPELMAGPSTDPVLPHPYLKVSTTTNDKIVDMRTAQAVGEIYTYQSDDYEAALAFVISPTYLNNAAWKVVDHIIPKNTAVLTELDYSVRTFTANDDYSMVVADPPADRICLFFGIDKGRLLKGTTALPALLDRLTALYYTHLTLPTILVV